MQTTFLNAAGAVLFTRDDMEQGNWTQEEYTVNATFPYVEGKVIQRGQRISFRDPATDAMEFFEIRKVTNIEPEHYQQIIAESIAVSELSDEHINNKEITDKTPAQALQTVLTGTLWAVGNVSATNISSADIGRGSVWQSVNTIATNWNVYIVPRVTVNNGGAITGRYLDIITTNGVFRGVRLSIDKNMSDSSVVYDDSEVLTALYGYGGSVGVAQTGQDDGKEELTFASVVWTATADHPAKPEGQTYLEDPAKTQEYGRNGRARFGYYQNSDISDPNILLQKTWDALKQTSVPKISISGTVSDLYRLGYHDEPLRLHDIVCIEIRQTGATFYEQIIRLDVDLLDPTATRPEIGSYIPNIIYINRDTNDIATTGSAGGGGGGGGGRGQKNQEYKEYETFATMESNEKMIAMVVGTRNGDNYIKAGEIGLAINKSGESGQYESTAYINADHVNISATTTAYNLAGELERDADGRLVIKNAGGMYVRRESQGTTAYFGVWDDGNITSGMVCSKINGETSTQIKGSLIVIGNDTTIDPSYRGKSLDGTMTAITTDFTSVNTLLAKKIEADDINATTVTAALANATLVSVSTFTASNSIGCTGPISGTSISAGGNTLNLVDASVSGDGKTLTITRVSGGAINFKKGDTDAAYNQGWNDCIDAAVQVDRYTRSAGQYGGNRVHYIFNSDDERVNVGSGWYQTSLDSHVYKLPRKKE